MTLYLIDTDMAIYAMAERHSALNDRLAHCYPGEVAISAISYAEIALGVWLDKPPSPEVLDAFVTVIPIMPFDAAAARQYMRLPFRRARFDSLLAAHALSLDAVIVTNNASDFADVPGLVTENWTQ